MKWLLLLKTSRPGVVATTVAATLAVLLMLPIASVVVFANAGISLISDTLVSVDMDDRVVEIFDPTGNRTAEIEVSTTWPARGVVTDEFGTRSHLRRLWGLGRHTGIDIASPYGWVEQPVTPFLRGTVTGVNNGGSCGIHVRIRHEHNIQSLYCHLSGADVIEGKEVIPGDRIGWMGNTGASTGPHLHFQIEAYGIPVDPRQFLVGEPERRPPDGSADTGE